MADRGDLEHILDKRRLRVLVPYTRPFFFIDRGETHGITAEMFREFGGFAEKSHDLRRGSLSVVYVPCELESILPWLEAGYGDVAAGALTITESRSQEIAFAEPLTQDVDEILITSANATFIDTLEDLAGREVWVAKGSSYAEHLASLDAVQRERGLAPIQIREASTLSTEDLLEMVNAGIFDYTVCDAYKGELWSGVLADLKLRPELPVHTGGSIAWGVRKENPELLALLNEFVKEARQGTLLGNVLVKRYFGSPRWITDPTESEHHERFRQHSALIREIATEFGFDWLRIAAQCFQESRLDPDAVSSSGAQGLMQLLPSTAADMGCKDPFDPEENLRAGMRYLAWLRKHFFDDDELDEASRTEFILAAYNAGPGTVRRWRGMATERGPDPNRWRKNVERIAFEEGNIQPIHYVDNIEKYYVAYTLTVQLAEERQRAKDSLPAARSGD